MWSPEPIRITNGKVFTIQIIDKQRICINGMDQDIFLGALAEFLLGYFPLHKDGNVSQKAIITAMRDFYLTALVWAKDGTPVPKYKVLGVTENSSILDFTIVPREDDSKFPSFDFNCRSFGLKFRTPPVLYERGHYLMRGYDGEDTFIIEALKNCYLPGGEGSISKNYIGSKEAYLEENAHLIKEVKIKTIVHDGDYPRIGFTAKFEK